MEPAPGEAQTIRRFQAGDSSAFEALMKHYEPYILGLLWRMTGERSSAEDLCQETFLKALRSLHGFRFQSSLKTWLFRIAHNAALDFLRGRGAESSLEDRDESGEVAASPTQFDPSRVLQESQIREALQAAVRALPAAQREVLHLFYWGDLSVEEIARVTETPEGTVKTHLFRGRQALRTGSIASLTGGGAP
jgi:RNA polymerase sigma factor (sigma-70 family)